MISGTTVLRILPHTTSSGHMISATKCATRPSTVSAVFGHVKAAKYD